MLGRKGVTLIELLIVVTILSILAGAAIPYVQDYIEDSRIGRARADLDEIRNALARYEVERGQAYTQANIASLVGPFLSKSLVDPWGAPYVVMSASSTAYSKGANGTDGGGDDIVISYRPPMAVSRVYWIDTNQDGLVNTGDSVHFKCTRPLKAAAPATANAAAGVSCSAGAIITAAGQRVGAFSNIASYAVAATFVPGSDTISLTSAGTSPLLDGADNRPLLDTIKILAQ